MDEDSGCKEDASPVYQEVVRNRRSGDPADEEHGDGPQGPMVPKKEGVARAKPVGRPEDAGADGERMGRRRNDRAPGERKLDCLPGVDPGRRDDTALPEAAPIEGDDRVPRG